MGHLLFVFMYFILGWLRSEMILATVHGKATAYQPVVHVKSSCGASAVFNPAGGAELFIETVQSILEEQSTSDGSA